MSEKKRERPSEWNTMTQAAAGRMLGVSRERVGQWIADGRLPAHRVEGWANPRILIADAERFARARERAPRH
jgi:excisionase family DNA binding protein